MAGIPAAVTSGSRLMRALPSETLRQHEVCWVLRQRLRDLALVHHQCAVGGANEGVGEARADVDVLGVFQQHLTRLVEEDGDARWKE